ncbi:MAG: peroxiredoxin [Hyphomicrobiaceae bacterium]
MIPWPWPAPADDGAAAHLEPGMPMPDIALATTAGRSLSLARVSGRAIVFIYPWTGRPGVADPPGWDDIAGAHGSTAEAQGFRNLHSSFASLDTAVLGLSSQDSAWQGELARRLALPFEILSDQDFRIAEALHLPTFSAGGQRFYKRISLLVRDGRIEVPFYPVHPPDAHARDVLACLTDLVGYELESRINS